MENILYYGDNLEILREHIKDESIDLICLDPHFKGFFSLFKRSVLGIYHFVSPKHIERYLTECTFRYNTKKETEESRFNLLLGNYRGRITYRELIFGRWCYGKQSW